MTEFRVLRGPAGAVVTLGARAYSSAAAASLDLAQRPVITPEDFPPMTGAAFPTKHRE